MKSRSLTEVFEHAVIIMATLALTPPLLAPPPPGAGGGNGNGGGGNGGGGDDGGGGEPPAAPEIAYLEDGDVWVMNADGSNQTAIFDGGWVYRVSWSPDGTHLALSADIDGTLGIWTVEADGSNLQLVTGTHWTSYLWDVQWSPAPTADGQERILFIELTSEADDGTFDVFAITPDGTDLVHLVDTPVPVHEQSCTWSPDATRIAVIEGDGGEYQGRTMVYDLGLVDGVLAVIGAEEIPNMPPDANDIDWARTQNKIAVSSFVGGNNTELWIIDLDDPASGQQITFFEHQDRNPTWAPDDSSLVFERFPRPGNQIGIRKVSSDGQIDTSLGAKYGGHPGWRAWQGKSWTSNTHAPRLWRRDMIRSNLVAGVAGVAAVVMSDPARGQCDPVESHKLLASDGEGGDWFGQFVAVSDTAALVGAVFHADNAGSAYLFDVATGQQMAKLVPDDNAPGHSFGSCVAVSGSVAIVGASNDDDNGDYSGSAYVFDISDPVNPVQLTKIMPLDGEAFDSFGSAAAASGNLVIITARSDDDAGITSGSAYIFDIADPLNPVELSKLLPEAGDSEPHFGATCAIHGSVVVVGAPADDPNGMNSGSAYLFDASDPSTPELIAKLVPDDGAPGSVFGQAVAASESIVVVGAGTEEAIGVAYVFDAATGAQITTIEASDPRSGNTFGQSLSIAGDILLVGAPDGQGFDGGSVYVYDVSVPASPTEVGQFLPNDIGDFDGFGKSVALSGSFALIGTPFEDEACGNGWTCNAGAAYLFDINCAAPCPADLTADGQVGVPDLLILMLLWGADPGGPPDFDGDGEVGVTDLIQLFTAWGSCS
jgi:WD40 repeat protein